MLFADLVADGLDVTGIVEQMQIDVEDGDRVLAVALAKTQGQTLQIVAHHFHCHVQPFQLLGVLLILARCDGAELLARPPHPGLGHGDATGAGDTTQWLAPVGFLQPALGLGLGDARGQLGCQRHHEGLLPLIETATVFLLHHQNAHHLALVHDGSTEEGAKRLFRNIRQELETGVGGGIGQVDQLFALAHQTDDTLLERQGCLAHRRLGQTIGRSQSVAAHVRLRHIDGTAVHRHGPPGLADQCLQSQLQSVGFGHAFDDASEIRQQRMCSLARAVAPPIFPIYLHHRHWHRQRGKLRHHPSIDFPFEGDNLAYRVPETDPTPIIKLGVTMTAELDPGLPARIQL